MNYDEVNEKWLTIGTDSKLGTQDDPVRYSESGLRVTMGEKGIGRLAIAVLGYQMLMITKRANRNWVLLLIHWGIFENGRLFLEDTVVPVTEAESLVALEELLLPLKDDLRSNLTRTEGRIRDAWSNQPDLRDRILQDIDTFRIDHSEFSEALARIERADHGTLFYVASLKENWEPMAATDKRSASAKRKLVDLQIWMGSFVNTIALFEGKDPTVEPEQHFEFRPSVVIDGDPVVNAEGFTPDDLQRYDYSLEGHISGGRFVGTVRVKDRVDQRVDRRVDDGIDLEDYHDCGPFKIRLFFVEGDAVKSFLDPTVHGEIKRKLSKIGGIYIYRDGLRVLPYGRVDFDFLKLDEQGSKDLGGFPLRNRRVFGYIAITKKANPRLQDKSSREGLRTNREYDFFFSVLMNLTKWWVVDFIVPHRDPLVKEVESTRKAVREENKLRLQREAELKKFVAVLKDGITRAKSRVTSEEERIRSSFKRDILVGSDLSDELAARARVGEWTYVVALAVLESLSLLEKKYSRDIANLGALDPLLLNKRFVEEVDVKSLLATYEEWVDNRRRRLRDELMERLQVARAYLNSQLGVYLKAVSEQLSVSQVQSFVYDLQELVRSSTQKVQMSLRTSESQLASQLNERLEYYYATVDLLRSQLKDRKDRIYARSVERLREQYSSAQDGASKLESLLSDFMTLRPGKDFSRIVAGIQEYVFKLSEILSVTEAEADLQIQRASSELQFPLLNALGETVEGDWKLISSLNEELQELNAKLEGYRQLASTGLAAEIVTHEFEHQYRLLRRLFERPVIQQLKASNRDLRNIEQLFKQIEERHRLLSPLYQRTRMYRKEIRLRDIGDQMAQFFQAPLKLYNIEFENRIDPELVVKESEAVVYPAFINVINNALFWLLSSKKRQILLHSDPLAKAIYIEDSGPGIESERADKIFDLFYSTRPDGRGIGLYLVRELLGSRNHRIYTIHEAPPKRLPGACLCIEFASSSIV